MNKPAINNLGNREKLTLSIGTLVVAVTLVAAIFTEPAVRNYYGTLAEIEAGKKEVKKINEADKQTGAKQLEPGRAIIYMYNYIDGLTQKSGVRYKNFQASGAAPAAGATGRMANFQLKLGSNASSFAKLLFMAENTIPSVSITSFRISSIAGGTLDGMRQLDTLAAVAISTKRLGGKTFYADEKKLKPLRRDPFAPLQKKAPPVKNVVVKEPEAEPELPRAETWTLTAAMSDAVEDGDTLLFKKSSGSEKYVLTLKKGGEILLSWSGENVILKIAEEKVSWAMGETLSEDVLPKKLIEAIKKGLSFKSAKPVDMETPSTGLPVDSEKAAAGLTDEELGRMGIKKDVVIQMQPGIMRGGGSNRRRR